MVLFGRRDYLKKASEVLSWNFCLYIKWFLHVRGQLFSTNDKVLQFTKENAKRTVVRWSRATTIWKKKGARTGRQIQFSSKIKVSKSPYVLSQNHLQIFFGSGIRAKCAITKPTPPVDIFATQFFTWNLKKVLDLKLLPFAQLRISSWKRAQHGSMERPVHVERWMRSGRFEV